MTGIQTSPVDLLVELGTYQSKSFIVLHGYTGSRHIGTTLLKAIDEALIVKYGEHRCRSFEYIRIVGEL